MTKAAYPPPKVMTLEVTVFAAPLWGAVMRKNLVGITPQSSRVGIRDAVRPGPTPS